MKNVTSLKSNAANSPKTPGGISKSLLTPCRRVGLSRNWRNKGSSPFISPLSGNAPEVKGEKIETRKRKESVLDDNIESLRATPTVDLNEIEDEQTTFIDKTPSRNIEVPRRKKSKILITAINNSQEDINISSHSTDDKSAIVDSVTETKNIENIEVVSTPVRTKSKKGKKKSPADKSGSIESKINLNENPKICNDVNIKNADQSPQESTDITYKIKENSPNDLKKECVVVIQRKIFKKTEVTEKEENNLKLKNIKSSSQALFDSDSDEVPLIQLNNRDTKAETENIQNDTTKTAENKKDLNEDEDFIEKSTKTNGNKLKLAKSPRNRLKTNRNIKIKEEKVKVQPKPSTQNSYEDEDDDFDNKKTILIRKTYEKVSKPLRAKSTGSITQKDIDELRSRIEAKKKLLLAKSISPDTEELRNLIKKWQKGCQDALMELLDLMKTKFSDKQDMDYSEMLKTLKIPPSLVGYDSENDCFNSPDDATIILGQFNDL